ncbi:DNA polymerase III subunit gamma/tau [Mesoplasma lactucae]|uniref:DNA polymerase III subunit gamma/tau n=1 Tax=Mesoplasma lactucae ATCC 49193 TaxID=81460 RepID=A0A291ISK9_9MOLU|nr:DNA polymerase III subunit gamma/tau [Mesoplasma lactucae]ATG97696.1 DNA polymerase III subunit gamma/tau [Mesoplasma lactucae ATCC 49193]ATZ19838.1 DNA polymerase III subunits gamma and tau [Mesoplasma lactucae ATCC 49193]MCL8216701.1 Holliday junction ATP-dependent DNA helicase RuvB [Mesoplasma lactucae ATCC 49193]
MEKHNSLYRTYRPSNFKDVAGHKNIVEILTSELKNNSFGHAYLFAGQRGTGKTSIARILAKAINCQNLQDGNPCDECDNCVSFNQNQFPDIYEIDAASNNGVDEIRNITNAVQTLPIAGKYKVYIIDEVHMLSKAAFNALLKTLEEPPAHVVFILATTEYDKIPQTIISRCQTFSFKKISNDALKERINFIAKEEGYTITEEAANEIYSLSEGSLRDALNVLEQLMIISNDTKNIDINKVKEIFYVATKDEKVNIIKNVINGEYTTIIDYFEKNKQQGMNFDVLTLALIKIIKELIEFKLTGDSKLLEDINEDDAQEFKNVPIEKLFTIADNLTDAYIKTKNNTASFDYILLSILKSIDNKDKKISIDTKPNVNEIEKPVVKFEQIPAIDNELIIATKAVQEPAMAIEEEPIELNQDDSFEEIEKNTEKTIASESPEDESLTFDSLSFTAETKAVIDANKIANNKNELIETQSEKAKKVANKTHIKYLISDLINVLMGVIEDKRPELRHELTDKIDSIFEVDDSDEFINKDKANSLASFFNTKVTAANNNEIIIITDTNSQADLINHELLNDSFRKELNNLLGQEYVVYAISANYWKESKITFSELKKQNLLPIYSREDVKNFYLNNKNVINGKNSEEDKELLKNASKLFDLDDINFGE